MHRFVMSCVGVCAPKRSIGANLSSAELKRDALRRPPPEGSKFSARIKVSPAERPRTRGLTPRSTLRGKKRARRPRAQPGPTREGRPRFYGITVMNPVLDLRAAGLSGLPVARQIAWKRPLNGGERTNDLCVAPTGASMLIGPSVRVKL